MEFSVIVGRLGIAGVEKSFDTGYVERLILIVVILSGWVPPAYGLADPGLAGQCFDSLIHVGLYFRPILRPASGFNTSGTGRADVAQFRITTSRKLRHPEYWPVALRLYVQRSTRALGGAQLHVIAG